MAVASVKAPAQRRLGQVLSFYSGRGGVGKTFLCANLAAMLVKKGYRTALVDLTLRLGSDLADWLGLEADRNFSDLLPVMDAIDPRALESYLLPHENGLRLLAAPQSPDRWQRIKEGHVEKAVHLLRYRYDFVLMDLATSFDNRILSVLPISHRIYTVVTPDGGALQNLGDLVRLLRLLGYGGRTRLILNRFTGRELLNVPEMEQVAGQPFDYMIPEVSLRQAGLDSSNLEVPGRLAKGMLPMVEELVGTESKAAGPLSRRFLPIIVNPSRTEANPGEANGEEVHLKEFRQNLQALVHQRVIEQVGPQHLTIENGRGARTHLEAQVVKVIDDVLTERVGNRWTEQEQQAFRQEMVDEILGLGHLEVLLRDPEITEIMVNGSDQVYVERRGQLILTDKQFTNDSAVIKIIERIIAPLGRRIDESSPMVDARLPDGSRVNAVIPPLSLNGPMLTIRKFLDAALTIDDLIGLGSLDEEMAEFLRFCVRARMNLVVCGGTGSGKTTLLNVLSSFIPPDERVITIEDAAELRLRQPHVGRLEARPANIEGKGAVSIRDLLRNALRMRPDRIIIGEVRGPETIDMLQAMNTGHNGSMTTAHANSPKDLMSRLETMVMMGNMDLPLRAIREQIASALDIVVHQGRFRDGSRKITEIAWIEGMEDDRIRLIPLFAFREEGRDVGGKAKGKFYKENMPQSLYDKLQQRGV
ncbi:MAG: Flp pilus assembly complex ATPase component TadA [Firmicutes bacterium]|jgi:pilus assembly protein CpaF|nr:Flp pilus assembly complex ATPase component TadA [Bacillota bacterium]